MKENFIKEFGELCNKYKINAISKMVYEDNGIDEIVTIIYTNGYKKQVYVTCDSESAMIKDIIRQGGF